MFKEASAPFFTAVCTVGEIYLEMGDQNAAKVAY
jgi:hypothetical protein